MKTENSVQDGKLTNEQLGGLTRRTNEIIRRINEGTLNFEETMELLQGFVIEKKPSYLGVLRGTHEIKTKRKVFIFNVWKTIKLGTHKNADELRNALKRDGFKISDWANKILDEHIFTVAKTEKEIQLVNVSVADLGFKNGATNEVVLTKANRLGLELCPNEVGPQLRLQYKDQPKSDSFRVPTKSIGVSDDWVTTYQIASDGSDLLWLDGYTQPPYIYWEAKERFVFRLRK